MRHNKLVAALLGAVMAFSAVPAAHTEASWDWKSIGCMGDLDGDGKLTQNDLSLLNDHLLGKTLLTEQNAYKTGGSYIGINGADGFESGEYLITADINQDGAVDTFDLVLMRKQISQNTSYTVWRWDYSSDDLPELQTPPDFMTPPIYPLYGSMPSQGPAKLLIFYVDFPDCKYGYEPTEEEIDKAAFGDKDMFSEQYPFESIKAFMKRASKNSMDLSGRSYRYTTKHEKAYYENDKYHIKLIDELTDVFGNRIDFSAFDGDRDNVVDSILISVPEKAGSTHWWPVAGIYGGDKDMVGDNIRIDHVIVGNSQIDSSTDSSGFVSSYCHELGHCLGLPDYYLYTEEGDDDFQGMHGTAGFELMDDANCDFGAASKLMLGWYREWDVIVWDPRDPEFVPGLFNAQSDDGNCLVIPRKSSFDGNWFSEFFIIEYTTLKGNNSGLTPESVGWWRRVGEGVRIYHVSAELNDNYTYRSWRYASGNDEATDNDKGRRFIRLVGEGEDLTDNLFHEGDVIDSSTPGFAWYNEYGAADVPVGLRLRISKSYDMYEVSVERG